MDMPPSAAEPSGNGNGKAKDQSQLTNNRVSDIGLARMTELVDNALMMRSEMIGKLVDPRRNLDEDCGYVPLDVDPPIDLMRCLYDREPLANRACQVMPKECMSVQPLIYEKKESKKQTAFEKDIDNLDKVLNGTSWYENDQGSQLWEYVLRADILSGIGHFGLLLLGVDDGKPLDQPLEGVVKIEYGGGSPLSMREQRSAQVPPGGQSSFIGPPPASFSSFAQPGPTAKSLGQITDWNPDRQGEAQARLETTGTDQQYDNYPGRTLPNGMPSEDYAVTGKKNGKKKKKKGKKVVNEYSWVDEWEALTDEQRIAVAKRRIVTRIQHRPVANTSLDCWMTEEEENGLQDITNAKINTWDFKANNGKGKVSSKNLGPLTEDEKAAIDRMRGQRRRLKEVVNQLNKEGSGLVSNEQGEFNEREAMLRFITNPGKFAGDCGLVSNDYVINPRWPSDQAFRKNDPAVASGAGFTSGTVDPSKGLTDGGWQTGAYISGSGVSLSGTDQQYYGVQFGPSETLSDKSSKKKHKLLFLRPFDESLVQIVRYEWNIRSARFGLPVMYRVTLNDPRQHHSGIGLPLATVFVHWSRVVHLADNLQNSEIFGQPRMAPVLNTLLDIRKVRGGSAEMYWRGAFPGLSLETNPQLGGDVEFDKDALRRSMHDYINGLNRWLALVGFSAKTLSPQVVDPTAQVNVQIQALCIQLSIPQRVFEGSERGQLASSQDDASWNDRVRCRQMTYLTPRVIVPLIDRLIACGVLSEPEQYTVEWPDLDANTDRDKASISGQKTMALAQYVQSGASAVVAPHRWLTDWMGMTDAEAESAINEAEDYQEEKQEEQQKQQMEQMQQQQAMGGMPGQEQGGGQDQGQGEEQWGGGGGGEEDWGQGGEEEPPKGGEGPPEGGGSPPEGGGSEPEGGDGGGAPAGGPSQGDQGAGSEDGGGWGWGGNGAQPSGMEDTSDKNKDKWAWHPKGTANVAAYAQVDNELLEDYLFGEQLANPEVVGNVNPKGCNQFTGPNCSGLSVPESKGPVDKELQLRAQEIKKRLKQEARKQRKLEQDKPPEPEVEAESVQETEAEELHVKAGWSDAEKAAVKEGFKTGAHSYDGDLVHLTPSEEIGLLERAGLGKPGAARMGPAVLARLNKKGLLDRDPPETGKFKVVTEKGKAHVQALQFRASQLTPAQPSEPIVPTPPEVKDEQHERPEPKPAEPTVKPEPTPEPVGSKTDGVHGDGGGASTPRPGGADDPGATGRVGQGQAGAEQGGFVRVVTSRQALTAPADTSLVDPSIGKFLRPNGLIGVAKAITALDSTGGFLCADGCVAGWTKIFNPLTGEHVRIDVLRRRGKEHTVLSLTPNGFEPRRAHCPFLKGVEAIYEITLTSGRRVCVTDKHRFLTPFGWRTLADGVISEGSLLGCAESLPESTWDISPSTRVLDDQHSLRKPQDCLDRYSDGSCPCDGLPHLAANIAPRLSPSPADVREHSLLLSHGDAQETSYTYTHPEGSDHLSRNSFSQEVIPGREQTLSQACVGCAQELGGSSQASAQFPFGSTFGRSAPLVSSHRPGCECSPGASLLVHQVASKILGHDIVSSQVSQQPHEGAYLTEKDRRSLNDTQDALCVFSCNYSSGWDRILSIREIGVLPYYDMYVPGPENYVAEGIVHHNTGVGKTRIMLGIAQTMAKRGDKVLVVTAKEAMKADFKKGTFGGSWKDDSDAMGIELRLDNDTLKLEPGKINLTSYQRLEPPKDRRYLELINVYKASRKRDAMPMPQEQQTELLMLKRKHEEAVEAKFNEIGKDTTVIWDEAHALKNVDSQRSFAASEMNKRAGRVMYATATPLDEPKHLFYLFRAGVFGGMPWADTFRELGLYKKETHSKGGTVNSKWQVNPNIGADEVARRMSGLFDQMTKEGLMLKREISFKGVEVGIQHVQVPQEAHDLMARIDAEVHEAMWKNPSLAKAVSWTQQRRQLEPYKIPAAVDYVKKELAEGRQVVVFSSRVNESEVLGAKDPYTGERKSIAKSEGTAKELVKRLHEAGITDIAEIHGGAKDPLQSMKDFQSGKARVVVATVESGGPQPYSADVLTPAGWVSMGSLKPGDTVIAGDGTPTVIKEIFEQGVQNVFEITTASGAKTRCTDNHLWSVKRWSEKVWKVRDLNFLRTHDHSKWMLPVNGVTQLEAQPITTDPYLLGLLLGDGSFRKTSPTFCNMSRSVINNVCGLAKTIGLRFLYTKEKNLYTGHFAAPFAAVGTRKITGKGWAVQKMLDQKWKHVGLPQKGDIPCGRRNRLTEDLRAMGLWNVIGHDKFVPQNYLWNTAEVRLAVLQGLMDTDGSVSHNGDGTSFCSKSKKLAEGAAFLVRSLGGVASITLKPQDNCYYVKVGISICPFRMSEKVRKWKKHPHKVKKNNIKSIVPVGRERCRCLLLDHPSHLYVTDNFVVTHNTGINLDDTNGDRPRSMLILTPPFSAVQNVQAAGRVWRLNTKSYPRIQFLMTNTDVDEWNAGIIAKKMQSLGAVVKGETVPNLTMTEEMREAGRVLSKDDIPEVENDPYKWSHALAGGKYAPRDVHAKPITPTAKSDTEKIPYAQLDTDTPPESPKVEAPKEDEPPVPVFKEGPPRNIEVSGNSFTHREAIKAAGGRWEPNTKTWSVDSRQIEKIKHLSGLTFHDPLDDPDEPGGAASTGFHLVSGNTYTHKDRIRAVGGRWDKARNAWVVPAHRKKDIEGLPGLRFESFNPTANELSILLDNTVIWEEEKHPRGEHGHFSTVEAGATAMVSPNVGESSDYVQAVQSLHSELQHKIHRIAQEVYAGMNVEIEDVVGDTKSWKAENSLLVNGNPTDFGAFRKATVLMGMRGNPHTPAELCQKGVILFNKDKQGADARYVVNVHEKDSEALRKHLDECGLEFRTIIPKEDGHEVVILDQGKQLANNIAKFSEGYNVDAHAHSGHVELIDAETREGARSIYQRILQERTGDLGRGRRESLRNRNLRIGGGKDGGKEAAVVGLTSQGPTSNENPKGCNQYSGPDCATSVKELVIDNPVSLKTDKPTLKNEPKEWNRLNGASVNDMFDNPTTDVEPSPVGVHAPSTGLQPGNAFFGTGGSPAPSKEQIANFESRVTRSTGAPFRGYDGEVENDPDIGLLTDRGRYYSPKSMIRMPLRPQKCHWNVAALYESGKIDKIVIGYMHNAASIPDWLNTNTWIQHTWGLKDGKIVETTPANFRADNYYGMELNHREANAFVAHAHAQDGVMRTSAVAQNESYIAEHNKSFDQGPKSQRIISHNARGEPKPTDLDMVSVNQMPPEELRAFWQEMRAKLGLRATDNIGESYLRPTDNANIKGCNQYSGPKCVEQHRKAEEEAAARSGKAEEKPAPREGKQEEPAPNPKQPEAKQDKPGLELEKPLPGASATKARYRTQFMRNVMGMSRTAKGVSDTSVSKDKPKLESSGADLAQITRRNALAAFDLAYDASHQPRWTGDQIKSFADSLNDTVNKDLTKPGAGKYRTWDKPEFKYTHPDKIKEGIDKWANDLAKRLNDDKADPIETAAWNEKEFGAALHPYADGVGRTTQALTAMIMARGGKNLPVYPAGGSKEHFGRAVASDHASFNEYFNHLVNQRTKGDFVHEPIDEQAENTKDAYKTPHDDGKPYYIGDRIKIHNDYFSPNIVGKKPSGKKPVVYFMGGGTSVGKSSITNPDNGGTVNIPKDAVHIDPDEAKHALPEYNNLMAKGQKERAAAFVHEESSDMADALLDESLKRKLDIHYDGTGNSSIEKLTKKINKMKEAGHKIVANYITCSIPTAKERAKKRENDPNDGRKVMDNVLEEKHRAVSEVFPEAIKRGLFDEFTLWDNENAKPAKDGQPAVLPVKVVSGHGTHMTVHDPELWQKFQDKGMKPQAKEK